MVSRFIFLFLIATGILHGQEVVPRKDWSVTEPELSKLESKPNGKIKYISIHQTETPFPDTVNEVRRLQSIQHWHQTHASGKKWGDIAYHFLIGANGQVFEGRDPKFAASSGTIYLTKQQWEAAPQSEKGLTKAAKPSGAKNPGASEGHLTISVIGSFNTELPNEKMRQSLISLIASKLLQYELTIADVYFHREIACWTDCPGQELYDWFRGAERKVSSKGPGLILVERAMQNMEGGR